MPDPIQGTRYTTHQSTETRAVRDVSKDINLLEPDSYPLTAIMNKAKNRLKVTGNYKYEWFEDTLLPRFDVLGGDLAAGAVSMTVTNYKYFRKGDLVRVNQSEIVFVSATPTDTTVTIRRAYGGTDSIATSGDQLHIMGNASDEGDTVGSYLTTQKSPMYNYVTLHRTPLRISGSAQASEVYGKSDLDWEKAKCVIEHGKDIEFQNILGERYLDTSNETRLSTSQGILSVIATNVKNFGGTTTEDEFEDWLRRCFRYGAKKTKFFIGSSKFMTVINSWGREKLETVSSEQSYGVTMTHYKNAGRNLLLNEHPLLENSSLTDLTGLAGTGMIIDLADLSFRYLKGRYMNMVTILPRTDSDLRDATTGETLTEGGLQFEQEKKHGEATGVTD